jgi:hypothetical protein
LGPGGFSSVGLSETGNGNNIEKDGKKVKDAAGQYKKMPDGMMIAKFAQKIKTDADGIRQAAGRLAGTARHL